MVNSSVFHFFPKAAPPSNAVVAAATTFAHNPSTSVTDASSVVAAFVDPRVYAQQLLRDKINKHMNGVQRLLRRQRFSEAAVELSKLVFLCPHDLHLLCLRARLLAYTGDFSECLATYQKALSLARERSHPDTQKLVRRVAHVCLVQGKIWLQQGQMEQATLCFEQGIATDRPNALLWINLALAHFNTSDFAIALARLTEYIEHVAPSAPVRTSSCVHGV